MILKILQRSKLTLSISGWRGGGGHSIILIHGVGLRAEAWNPMIPLLERHFALTVIDMPGHGDSPIFTHRPELGDYTNRIAEVLDKTGAPVFVVGHSMGALITMDLAIKYPELVSAIAPLNSVFQRTKAAKSAVAKRAAEIRIDGNTDPSATLDRWFGKRPAGEIKLAAKDCQTFLTSCDAIGYDHAYSVFAKEDGPSIEALQTIKCPALFVTGSEEPNSTPAMSQALSRHIARGKAITVKGARHMMPMTHPQIVSKFLIEFYESNGANDGNA